MDETPVTIVVSRHVLRGHEAAFERVLRDGIGRLVTFPGHLGALILHPHAGGREYGAVLRFRSVEDWERFRESPVYGGFLAELRPHLADDPRTEAILGPEVWFPWGTKAASPPRWKLALMTWVGVCVTVGTLGPVLGPPLADWPWLVRLLVINAAVVAALTWAVMPMLTWLVRGWLTSSPGERE